MIDKYDDINISSSLEIYIISDIEYIMKRTLNNVEYFYCTVKKMKDTDNPVNTIKGRLNEMGAIMFDCGNFHLAVSADDLGKFEYLKLLQIVGNKGIWKQGVATPCFHIVSI